MTMNPSKDKRKKSLVGKFSKKLYRYSDDNKFFAEYELKRVIKVRR